MQIRSRYLGCVFKFKYRLPNCGSRLLFENSCVWAFDSLRRYAAPVFKRQQ